jgi:hypothetical protein
MAAVLQIAAHALALIGGGAEAAVRSTGPVIRRRNVQLRVKPLIIGK